MSDLTSIEKLKLEKLLNMESGYVLDFSNKTFENFILENSNIDVYKDKNYNDSKANILRTFWIQKPNHVVGKLLNNLLEHWKTQKQLPSSEITSKEQGLYEDCLEIAERLVKNNPIQNLETSNISKIDHVLIQEHVDKCDKKIIDGDFSGAITNARSLIETVLLYIKFQLLREDKKFDGDLNSLYKDIAPRLNLSIDKNKKIDDSFKKMISGLFSIVSGIAELGNDLGDRHGKANKNYTVEKHHTILVVNSAKAFTEFILSSYEKQKK